tara:strand:+ start:1558 stop:2079 length:522 start_codon:yes stop_codon:yes gene_type:complete
MSDTFVEGKIWTGGFCSYLTEMAAMKQWAEGKAAAKDGVRSCSNTELLDPEFIDPIYKFVQDNNIWGFDLLPHPEPIQVLRYREGDYYNKHTDWSLENNNLRKISVSVQLSEPDEYEGCDLLLHDGPYGAWSAHREAGTVTMFPSWTLHEVTKCTSGERWVAVAWFLGKEPYK